MEINIEEQKQKFIDLCRAAIHREGFDKLLDWMSRADFFTAPASTHYHGGYAGGLCQHSMDVYEYAKRIVPITDRTFSEESLAVAALLHDLCKVNFYRTDFRNQKINGEWQQVPCYTVSEKFKFGGHGSKSVFLIQQFMKLLPDEAIAINCHMGAFDNDKVGECFAACPLAWVIHVADEAATYLIER